MTMHKESVTIGYHASHEQFSPSDLLAYCERAVEAGFADIICSDHFHPWSRTQGQSGFAWSWLGAAMARSQADFGLVTSPVGRYHPAVVAQACATLAVMFPSRFWVAVGSGEALNESITGQPWPSKGERNQRLSEAAHVMRSLWAGETVEHEGLFRVRHARLYTRPPRPPKVLLAALSPETARWGAEWADGLITIATPEAPVREVIKAFREGGGEGKPISLQVKLSYARTEEAAREGAYLQWRTNAIGRQRSENLETPEQFERCASDVSPGEIDRAVHISSDLERHRDWLASYLEMGASHLYLHNVNLDQEEFIDAFGNSVLGQAIRHGHH